MGNKPQHTEDSARSVQREAEAAKDVVSILKYKELADDTELVSDTIEGETNLVEAIGAALDHIDECEVMLIGLKEKKTQFASRETQIKARVDRLKAAIEQALMVCELDKMQLPTATLSLRSVPEGYTVVEEADIPTKFFKNKPVLDKAALTAAAKEAHKTGQAMIPGVARTNGGCTLAIRRK